MNSLIDAHQLFSHDLLGAYLAIALSVVGIAIVWYYEEQDKKAPTFAFQDEAIECHFVIYDLPYEAVIDDYEVDWDWPDRKQFPYDHERKRPNWLRLTSQ